MGTSFDLIQVANTDAARAVAIPSPVLAGTGAEILVKDTSGAAGTNAITVTPVAGLIDGVASYDIASNSGFVMLRSDGVSWLVVGTSEVGGGGGGVATSVANAGLVTVTATGSGNDVSLTAARDVQVSAVARDIVCDANRHFSATAETGDASINNGAGGGQLQLNATGQAILKNGGQKFEITALGVVNMAGSGAVNMTAAGVARVAVDDGSGAAALTLDPTGDSGNGTAVLSGSLTTISGVGSTGLRLQPNAAKKISEHGGTGSVQAAAIVNASGGAVIDSECRTAVNALLAYFRLRGTVHA